MTAKEKALELVDRLDETLTYLESKSKAKQCALICVDEILGGSRLFYIEDYSYWQEVKEEINKL